MEVHPKVSNGRSQTFVCFHFPLVAAAGATSLLAEKIDYV